MTLLEAINQRHSVRSYTSRPIEREKLDALCELTDQINRENTLHFQLVTDEPEAFSSRLAHYGKFVGVSNYFALVGPKHDALDETVGYWGECLVLKAQQLGLNTCWVGLTYKKVPSVVRIAPGEKLVCVVAMGYGATSGVSHKIKSMDKVCHADGEMPQWFRDGVQAALLAPTAMNQQKFKFSLRADRQVEAKAGWGFFSRVDLGIVKYHFEVGAGEEQFSWTE